MLFRRVVERLALIDDVNGQKLDRLVTDDFVCAVRLVSAPFETASLGQLRL
jgi:hypothetical protein